MFPKSVHPVAACVAVALAGPAAAEPPKLAVSTVNLYLIWENSGKLSENMKDAEHISMVSAEGSASQVLVDVVVEGQPDTLYEDVPTLRIAVRRPDGFDGGVLEEKSVPISYIQGSGKLYTTVVVDHGCEPFTVEAAIDRDGVAGAPLVRDVRLDCGD